MEEPEVPGKQLRRNVSVSGKRIRELAETLINFFEGFGAGGEKTFKGDAEIGFENIALPAAGFLGIDVIGGGNGIAALMLGEIHGGIGDLDEFLRRRAVQWIAGDTKAGADIFLAEKRIGGNPSTEFGGQLASLFHGGFRHEDDEFVSTVTGNDIGAAAIGFEDLADALQDEVAFQDGRRNR